MLKPFSWFRIVLILLSILQLILLILAFVGSYKNSPGLNNSYLIDVHLNHLNLTTLFSNSTNSTSKDLELRLEIPQVQIYQREEPTATISIPDATNKDFFSDLQSIATAAATAAVALADGLYTTVSQVFLNIADQLTYADLGLAEVYSFSNWGYCRGYRSGYADFANNQKSGWDNSHINWTYCTPPTANYRIDPLTILKQEVTNMINQNVQGGIDIPLLTLTVVEELKVLVNTVTYNDFNLPGSLQKKLGTLHSMTTASFVLILLAIIFVFISLCIQLVAFFLSPDKHYLTFINFLFQCFIFLFSLITAALITASSLYVRRQINENTESAGMRAFLSVNLYAYLWTATVAAFIVLVLSFLGHFFGLFGTGRKKYRSVHVHQQVVYTDEKH